MKKVIFFAASIAAVVICFLLSHGNNTVSDNNNSDKWKRFESHFERFPFEKISKTCDISISQSGFDTFQKIVILKKKDSLSIMIGSYGYAFSYENLIVEKDEPLSAVYNTCTNKWEPAKIVYKDAAHPNEGAMYKSVLKGSDYMTAVLPKFLSTYTAIESFFKLEKLISK